MIWQQYLENLKDQEADMAWVHGYDSSLIIQGANAWIGSDVRIKDEELSSFPSLNEDTIMFKALWNSVTFNIMKFRSLITENFDEGFIMRLVNARLIYPDGTMNNEWIERLIIQERFPEKEQRN